LEVTAGCFTFFTTFLIFLVFGGGSFTEGASTALLLLGVLEALAALTGVAFFTSDLAYLAKTFLVLVAVFFFSVFFFFSAYFFFFYSASSFVFSFYFLNFSFYYNRCCYRIFLLSSFSASFFCFLNSRSFFFCSRISALLCDFKSYLSASFLFRSFCF